jgi:hypothetical protein
MMAYLSSRIDLERSARDFGLLQRIRQIGSAGDLLRLALAYGPGGQSLRETAAWADIQGAASLSASALMRQLADSGEWLEHIALSLLPSGSPSPADRRHACGDLRIIDGSIISSPGTTKAWRLHATYDLSGNRFCAFSLTSKTIAEALERGHIAPGAVHIADRVYARPQGLRHVVDQGGDFLVRLGVKSLRLLDCKGNSINLPTLASRATSNCPVDMQVVVDRHAKRVGSIAAKQASWKPLPARLVIIPKPTEAAIQSRKKAARASQQGMHQLQEDTLRVADHLVLLTTLNADAVSPEQLRQMYRQRWQIELAFKRLKSLLHMDRLPAKNPKLAKAWLAAHLIIALLIDAISPQVRDSPP